MKDIEKKITWDRLSEIATSVIHALMESDMETAMEHFAEELGLTEEEREYFCVPRETDETETRCAYCPYHWQEEWEDFPCCHFDETYHPTPAPCEYEETEEFDWEDYY